MRKKDYGLIASAIKTSLDFALMIDPTNDEYNYGIKGYHYTLVKDLARELENTNPRFDYNRFLTACGIEPLVYGGEIVRDNFGKGDIVYKR